MGDAARLPIQSVQGAREETHPQNAIGILVDRLHPAGRESVGIGRPVHVLGEPLMPEIEHVEPRILRSHPDAADSRKDRVPGLSILRARPAVTIVSLI